MPRRKPFRTLDGSNNPSHPFACENLGGEFVFAAANGLNGSNGQPLELQMKNSTAIAIAEMPFLDLHSSRQAVVTLVFERKENRWISLTGHNCSLSETAFLSHKT